MSQEQIQTIASYVPLLVLLGVTWFLLIRPQQLQAKKRRQMLENLKRGDVVVTIGGIQGRIERIDDKKIKLRVADQVVLDMVRESVGYVVKPDQEK